eukprot:TRINITY_DN6323_c0_g1_i1.p1 TRINITY_DN6323_c0_g1~~TRINITY_DN6323_c0_g1_i1.p1  ORF type:complete len:381 (+),score=79.03 TRINITY_DN6323_c0_g1_i1:142-1284(+)
MASDPEAILIHIDDQSSSSKLLPPVSRTLHRKSLSGGGSRQNMSSSSSSLLTSLGETDDSSINYTIDGDKSMNIMSHLRYLWNDKEGQKLLIFTSLRVLFTLVTIYVGFQTDSLALVSISFHMCFDSFAMTITLLSMAWRRRKPTEAFSYGYERFEVLSGFSNASFLIFVALFIFFESIEKLLHAEQIDSGPIMTVAVLGFIVNLIGILYFHKQPRMRSESKDTPATVGLFQHILLDNITILALFISSWLTQWGWVYVDPIVAVLISTLVLFTAIPLAINTGRVLLQTTPKTLEDELTRLLKEISAIEGVLKVKHPHFWTLSPGVFVGSLIVIVHTNGDEQSIMNSVVEKLSPFLAHLTVQVEKDEHSAHHHHHHHHSST